MDHILIERRVIGLMLLGCTNISLVIRPGITAASYRHAAHA